MDGLTLQALQRGLGIDDESLAALALLPLIQVAWADGAVQERERRLILDRATRRGLLAGEGERLLEGWLRFRPSERYFARGRAVLAELCDRAGRTRLPPVADLVAWSEEVARQSGGLWGTAWLAVSPEEAAAIREIAEILAHPLSEVPRALLEESSPADPSEEITELDGPAVLPDPPELGQDPGDDPEDTVVDDTTGWLILNPGRREARVLPLSPLPFDLGRRSDNHLVLSDDGDLSRAHCRFHQREGRWYVVDRGSTNGTWVGGERVLERRLRGGESLRMGGSTFRFLCREPDTPPDEP
jgi:hypothetical protein